MKYEPNIDNFSDFICCLCAQTIEGRVSFNNKEIKSFIYIPFWSHAHIECYVKKIIEKKLEIKNDFIPYSQEPPK